MYLDQFYYKFILLLFK